MKFIDNLSLFCTIGLMILLCGCSPPESLESGKPELMNLEFTRPSYPAEEALIIRATPNPEQGEEFFRKYDIEVTLTSSSGDQTLIPMGPWQDLSDEEMVEAIKEGKNKAILRIKEADKKSARNSKGRLVRSEEAMSRFIAWAENHEQLSVTWVSELHPDVVIQFTTEPTVDMVRQIRTHENVEFMEPDNIGEYLAISNGSAPVGDLTAVIIPSSESFAYQHGDTVTAEFQQADGTVLKTFATITE